MEQSNKQTTKIGALKAWIDRYAVELMFGSFIFIIFLMFAAVLISNDIYRPPVYELEVGGHNCIGYVQTIDLTKSNPHASIVHCADGTVVKNAINIRYIRMIEEGGYEIFGKKY
jgi:hypothetical protein